MFCSFVQLCNLTQGPQHMEQEINSFLGLLFVFCRTNTGCRYNVQNELQRAKRVASFLPCTIIKFVLKLSHGLLPIFSYKFLFSLFSHIKQVPSVLFPFQTPPPLPISFNLALFFWLLDVNNKKLSLQL